MEKFLVRWGTRSLVYILVSGVRAAAAAARAAVRTPVRAAVRAATAAVRSATEAVQVTVLVKPAFCYNS